MSKKGLIKCMVISATMVLVLLGTIVANADISKVNQYYNGFTWNNDGMLDEWKTPEELREFGGDCEDFATAKYFELRKKGIPAERLRLAYFTAGAVTEAAHVALIYYPANGEPVVLDNVSDVLRPLRWYPDPVYTFNELDTRVGNHVMLEHINNKWVELLASMRGV